MSVGRATLSDMSGQERTFQSPAPVYDVAVQSLGEHARALVYFDVSTGTPLPVRIEIDLVPDTKTTPHHLSRTKRARLVDAFTRSHGRRKRASTTGLTSADVRGVNLTEAAGAVMSQLSANDRRDEEAFLANLDTTALDPQALGYRRQLDLDADVERALASLVFERLCKEGQADPVAKLADLMTGGDHQRARNVISAARRRGYLTTGFSGRSGGHTLPALDDLLESLRGQTDGGTR